MIRVLVASPYPAVRAGLRVLLQGSDDLRVVEDGQVTPTPLSTEDEPTVLLVDGEIGTGAVESLASARLNLPVVVLGGDFRGDLTARAAPRGYLRRDASAEEIINSVRSVASGLTVVDPARLPEVLASGQTHLFRSDSTEPLTPREKEVLQLLADGLPNKTIARQLEISEHTAKFHVSSLLAKLGAYSRTEAVSIAARRGLLVL